MTRLLFSWVWLAQDGVRLPQDVVRPYTTCVSLGLFVVQLIVTLEDRTDMVDFDITGPVAPSLPVGPAVLMFATVTVRTAPPVLPAASRAETVSVLEPGRSGIAPVVQVVVPAAMPLPPRLFVQVTWVTPTLSEAVPLKVRVEPLAVKVGLVVGDVMVTEGAVASAVLLVLVPVPSRVLERVLPLAMTLRFALTVVFVTGANRTVTALVAPTPLRVNGLPDTTLKGAATAALPEIVPPPVFETVKTWSAKPPTFTLPKFTVPVGLKANSDRATALATLEQTLCKPIESTAVTATL
jgi:hypothetical protein